MRPEPPGAPFHLDDHSPAQTADSQRWHTRSAELDFRRVVRCLGLFALITLPLASVGLHGTLAYHVLRRAGWLLTAGLTLDPAAAYPATQLVQSLLFETTPLDPAGCVGAALVLALVAAAARLVPALVDPSVVLKGE